MELEDLKGAWKQQTQKTANKQLSDDELFAMLRSKANNTIDLLKKSVRFELWFTVLIILICMAVGLISKNQTIRNISFLTIIISGGFAFYYYKKLSLLNNLNVENKSIKENLTNLLAQFEKFLWYYRWGYNILIPIAFLVGAFIGIQVATEKDSLQLALQIKLWAILIVILVPLAILLNFAMKWYLKVLYGNHLSHLHSLLMELED